MTTKTERERLVQYEHMYWWRVAGEPYEPETLEQFERRNNLKTGALKETQTKLLLLGAAAPKEDKALFASFLLLYNLSRKVPREWRDAGDV